MNLGGLKVVAKNVGKWIAKHSPTILTVMGTGGIVTTVGLAIKATPRANKKIEARKEELGVEKLPIKETVKVCWKDYTPTAGVMLATIGCFFGANFINARHQAAIAGLYSLAEQGLIAKDKQLSALKEEMVKNLGEEKANEIQKKVEQETHPVLKLNDSGRYLFKFDGQFFYAKPSRIWKAENRINQKLYHSPGMCVSLNEVLDELDLDHDPVFGEKLFLDNVDEPEFIFGETGFTNDGELFVHLSISPMPHEGAGY